MIRMLVAAAAVAIAIQCTDSRGQGHGRRIYRAPSIEFFGLGGFADHGRSSLNYYSPHGFNPYAYDPYLTGSFRAPDLLDDPHFRARHRYDSHFPGRRRHQEHKRRWFRRR